MQKYCLNCLRIPSPPNSTEMECTQMSMSLSNSYCKNLILSAWVKVINITNFGVRFLRVNACKGNMGINFYTSHVSVYLGLWDLMLKPHSWIWQPRGDSLPCHHPPLCQEKTGHPHRVETLTAHSLVKGFVKKFTKLLKVWAVGSIFNLPQYSDHLRTCR